MDNDKHTPVHFDREKMQFVGLSAEVLENLHLAYERIDIESELRKMALWLTSSKGTKRKGNINFIMNWLGNAYPTISNDNDLEQDSVLSPYLHDYRKDLWKGREHILLMNKRKS